MTPLWCLCRLHNMNDGDRLFGRHLGSSLACISGGRHASKKRTKPLKSGSHDHLCQRLLKLSKSASEMLQCLVFPARESFRAVPRVISTPRQTELPSDNRWKFRRQDGEPGLAESPSLLRDVGGIDDLFPFNGTVHGNRSTNPGRVLRSPAVQFPAEEQQHDNGRTDRVLDGAGGAVTKESICILPRILICIQTVRS